MKKICLLIVSLVLCLVLVSTSMADGLLPTISNAFSGMPTMRKILLRDPDSVSMLEDGGSEVTFLNVTEDEYEKYSVYLSESGCTLAGYSVDGAVMTASVEKNGHTFTFTYDYSNGTVVISYPSDTNEENFDVAAEIARREAVKASYQPGNYVTFGTYPQTAEGADSTDIEWLVLARDGQKALLISRYALDCQPYNTSYADVTWETCTLRTWLNSTFINKAFTSTEQTGILTTTVDNSKSQCYSGWSTSGGNNTQDKVFLLSYAEANKYFYVQYWKIDGATDNIQSRVAPTAYAIAQGADTDSSKKTADGKAAGYWCLRSPGGDQRYAVTVLTDGSFFYLSVDTDFVAVRPALWINLESDIF